MIPGQIAATDATLHNCAGLLSEKELAKEVKALPAAVGGKVIGDGTEIVPVTEAGQIVKLSIEHGKWKFLSTSDTFSITDSAGEPFAGGAHIVESKSLLLRNRIVIKDKDDKPICLAVQEVLTLNKKYDVYGLKPLKDGDVAVEKEDGIDFYPWFRVRDIDSSHLAFRSLQVWNGNNFQPMMRVVPAMRRPDDPNIGNLLPPVKGDNLVVDCEDSSKVYALVSKTSKDRVAGWDIQVAPGADTLASKWNNNFCMLASDEYCTSGCMTNSCSFFFSLQF
jgi:hypothetical protein